MERLNVKSVSVFIVLNILLVCLVSTQAMADPVQEQVECDFDLPVGPFLRLEGTDIEIDVLGQTLRGDFVFEKVTPPPPIITINPGTPTRSGLVVPIRGDDSSVALVFKLSIGITHLSLGLTISGSYPSLLEPPRQIRLALTSI